MCSSSLTQLAMVLATLKGLQERIRSKSRFTCGVLVMANFKRGSRVAVVPGCFPEGGDSFLNAFFWETLLARLPDN